tara:strand:- start:1860 stop:2819 length:960 start_codon:yes stop_codon:yes gene_type:complete
VKIISDILWGAATQFGREFGRAGANQILKGSNHYVIKGQSDYSGRIKPSDSEIVRAYKEINRIKFVQSNKANVSRLIEITDRVLPFLDFNNDQSLDIMTETKDLLDLYHNKVDHGNALIDDSFNEESAIFLEEKIKLLVQKLKNFNSESKDWVEKNLEISSNKRKSKSTFMILSLLLGGLGIQKAYIGHWGYFFLSLVFSFTFIPAIIGLYDFVKTLFTSVDKFDSKFNKDYTYYNQFTFISDIELDDNVTENQIVNDKETKELKTSPEIKAAEMEVKKYEDALNEIDSSSQKGKADKSLLEGALNSARSKLKQLRENN